MVKVKTQKTAAKKKPAPKKNESSAALNE